MSRLGPSDEWILDLGTDPVRCDLVAVEPELQAGYEAMLHCTALVGGGRVFWKVNVEGTEQLLDTAREVGVSRFIYLGTEDALFHGQGMVEIDETSAKSASTPLLYSETKACADRRASDGTAP